MRETFYILALSAFLASCTPASKHEQLKKISDMAKEMFDAGYSTDALPFAEKSLEFSIREFGEMSQETANECEQLAFIFYEKRMFGSARKEYSRLIRILNTLPGADKTSLVAAYKKLASISLAFEDIEGALELYKHLTDLQRKFLGDTQEDTIDDLYMKIRIQAYLKNFDALYKDIDELVELLEKKEGLNTITSKKYLEIKLTFKREEHDLEGQLPVLQKLIDVYSQSRGFESIEVADYLNIKADVLIDLEQFSEALKVTSRALAINKKQRVEADPQLITTYQKLAIIHQNLQEIQQAEAMLLNAAKLAKKDELNIDLYEQTLQMQSSHYLALQDYEKAEKILISLLNLHKTTLGESHPNLIYDFNSLAECYSLLKQYVKAQAALEESLQLASDSFGPNSALAVEQINHMAMLSYKAEKYPQAITKCKETIHMLKQTFPENHPNYMPIYKSLILIYKTKKDYINATLFSEKALKVSEFVHGNKSLDIIQELSNLVDIYKLQDMPEKAIAYAKREVDILQKVKESDRLQLAEKLNELGSLYETSGDVSKAKELFEKSRKMYAEPQKQ
ncbi:MAG: tetratricopeptide repeat protein [Lentisphaerales bacterium]|nr:tetratricopeptide repeat protein [Lentisphaerales bacterium]